MTTNENDQMIDTVAAGIAGFIAADDSRGRFERFSQDVTNNSKLTTLLREVEADALLSGRGSAVSRDAARTLGATGSAGNTVRDELFFAVTGELSTNGVNLSGVTAPSAVEDEQQQHHAA